MEDKEVKPSSECALEAVRTLIRFIGDDPTRAGLLDTPERVLRAWEADWGWGYSDTITAEDLLRTFPATPGECAFNQMVCVKQIAVFSHCEHHLTPFFGEAHIAYIPSTIGIVGISKLARVVDYFARRLQVQERLTEQTADFLEQHLTEHVGVMFNCTHMCMVSRGVRQPNARTQTTSLRGDFLNDATTRSEFLRACTSN